MRTILLALAMCACADDAQTSTCTQDASVDASLTAEEALLEGAHFTMTCEGPNQVGHVDLTLSAPHPEGDTAGSIACLATGGLSAEPAVMDSLGRGAAFLDPFVFSCTALFATIPGGRYLTLSCIVPDSSASPGGVRVAIQQGAGGTVTAEGAAVWGASTGMVACDATATGTTASYSFTLGGTPPFTVVNLSRSVGGY